MPKTIAELAKEFEDFKLRVAMQLEHLQRLLDPVAHSEAIHNKADKTIVDGVLAEMRTLRQYCDERFDKLEAKLEAACKERLGDRSQTLKDTITVTDKSLREVIDTRFKHLDDRLKELKADTHQRRTWAISISGIVLSATVALLIALFIKK